MPASGRVVGPGGCRPTGCGLDALDVDLDKAGGGEFGIGEDLRQRQGVPGLLQTEAYAHAVITGVLPMASEREVEQRVRARVERHRLLSEPGTLKLWAILDEAALHRQVGNRDVMRRQREHLIKAANEPNVIVQVIRTAPVPTPGCPARLRCWTSPTRPIPM